MDYLENAKNAMEAFCNGTEEAAPVYAREVQISALVAITEQLKRIADVLERHSNERGFSVVTERMMDF